MARPTKTNLDYFPFDCDFFEDEKIVAIAGEFGIKGELTTVKLLCAIYRNGYFIEWNDMLKMKLIRQLPGVSLELLNQIVGRLVKWGFFDPNLFSTAKILTSRGIQNRYFEATRKRKQSKEKMPYLVVNSAETPVYGAETPVFGGENPLNESKLNNNPPSTPPGGEDEPVQDEPMQDEPVQDWFEVEIANVKKSQKRTESFLMIHHITQEQLYGYLDRFRHYAIATEMKKPVNPSAYINGWIRGEIANDRNNGTSQTKTTVYADRRGTDADGKKEKNWKDSL